MGTSSVHVASILQSPFLPGHRFLTLIGRGLAASDPSQLCSPPQEQTTYPEHTQLGILLNIGLLMGKLM